MNNRKLSQQKKHKHDTNIAHLHTYIYDGTKPAHIYSEYSEEPNSPKALYLLLRLVERTYQGRFIVFASLVKFIVSKPNT